MDEGININVSRGPKQILGEGGKVTGVELVRCTEVLNKEGRFNPSFDERITKSMRADMVVFPIGQSSDLSLLPKEIRTTNAVYDRVSSRDKTLKLYDGFYHEIFNEPGRERVFADMEAWLVVRM